MLYSTNTVEIIANNNPVGSIGIDLAASPAGVGGIQFVQAGTNSHFEVAIGNIQAQSIPESGAAGLLGLGGALLLTAIRYQKTFAQ